MDAENKNTNIISGIVSTDMTKLISADSFMSALGKSPTLGAPMDPDAPQSFEALCSVLTNDTLIYFQKPNNFPKNPRPVMAAWNMVAADMIEKGKVAKPAPTEPLPSFSVAERCQIMIGPFNKYISTAGISDKLCRWARFQFFDPELMVVFWQNNCEEELQTALDTILQHCGQIPTSFQATFKRFPASIDSVSSMYLKEREWTPEEFTVAYIFWAFVKGYRYAASLKPEHIYAVHWLRERAMKVDVKLRTVDQEYLRRLFPWGHFLSELIQYPKFKFDSNSITEAILNLREYTIGEHYRATDEKKLHQFTRDGLQHCLPKELGAEDWYTRLKKSADIVLPLLALATGENLPAILSLVINSVDLSIPESAKSRINLKGRQLRLLFYRSTISSLIKRHRKELNNYLNAHK
jgi:hypothetical protein